MKNRATWCLSASSALLLALFACRRVPPPPPPPPIPQPHFRDECTRLAAPRRVGYWVDPPLLIHRVDPKSTGVKGIVIVETIIDVDGNVCDAAVLKGIDPAIDAAALAAVKQWRFKPAMADGHPVAVYFDLTVRLS